MDLVPVLDTWRQVLTVDFLRYFLTAAPFYALFWVWRPRWLHRRRLQPDDPARKRVASEVAYSMSTVVIFSAIGLCLVYAQQAGLTRIYVNVAERGWPYFWASLAVATVAHDAYFYWTHRLLHWRPLFRLAHHVHHRSTSPTPWAAYAFHPIEALIQAGIYLVIVFMVPMHPLALMLFLTYMIVRNVVGHLGFEVWPAGFARHPLTGWHLTPTHHDLHHRFGKGNYGLYFSLWDEWMGTSRPDYVRAYEAVTARRDGTAGRPIAAAGVGLSLTLVALLAPSALAADASPEGRWSTIDDRTGEVRSIVRVQIEDGELRGHVEKVVTKPGQQEDPKCTRCRGARRDQRVVGMQILSGYRRAGDRWTGGRVLDPENGKEYSSAVWLEERDRLRVRGYWGPFYRTQTWRRVDSQDGERHFWPDLRAAAIEMGRILKAGGRLLLGWRDDPGAARSFPARVYRFPGEAALVRAFEDAGYGPVRIVHRPNGSLVFKLAIALR
jgi:Delta7-sterol 5-desaturase